MAEGEDPFGSLIKLCQPTTSQELKLQSCPFARESETLPSVDSESDFDTSSLTPTPSEVTGIHMVSPPETESDKDSPSIDKITPPENEVFQTPPEHHNRRSSSSSQEFLSQREKPGDAAGTDGGIEETACLEDGVLLRGGQNLGFLGTEELNGVDGVLRAECWGNVNVVEGIIGFEKLRRFRVFDDELEEPSSKKIRVSAENWDWDKLCVDETGINDKVDCTEVIDLECEEIYDGLVLDKGKGTVHGNSSVKDMEDAGRGNANGRSSKSCGSVLDGKSKSVKAGQKSQYVGCDAVPDERMEEKAVKEDRVEQCPRDNVDLAPGNSVGLKAIGRNEGMTMTNVDSAVKDVEENVGISKHGEVQGNGIETLGCKSKRVEGTKKLNGCGTDGVVYKDKGDEICLKRNIDLSLKSSVEKARDDAHQDMRKDAEGPSGNKKSIKEIESFRYDGCGTDHARGRVPKRRRELPLSMRGKENDAEAEGEDKHRNMKVNKGSWRELIDALEMVFKKVDESSEDVDFLETAKRRDLDAID